MTMTKGRIAGRVAMVLLTLAGAVMLAAAVAGWETKDGGGVQTAATECTGCSECQPIPEVSGEIVTCNCADFQSVVLDSQMPVLVDFYAEWCPPCRSLHPNLEEIARVYVGRCKVVQVNVDNNRELAEQYRIRSIPALFMIKGGRVAGKLVGYQEKRELRRFVDRYL